MNKLKILLLSFVSLILGLISAVFVYAAEIYEQPGAAIGEALYSALGWLTIDIADIGVDDPATFYARFLIWIVLFAALYFASLFIFKEQKKIAVAMAAVLAIIGAIAIPELFVRTIFESYALFFTVVLIALPIVGLFYLGRKIKEIFPNSPRAYHLINALLFWFMLTLFNGFNEGIKQGAAKGIFRTLYQYDAWFGFAFALCLLLMLWHFAALVMGMGAGGAGALLKGGQKAGEKVGEALGEHKAAGGFKGSLKRLGNTLKGTLLGEAAIQTKEFKFLNEIKKQIENLNADLRAAGRDSNRRRKILKNYLPEIDKQLKKAEELDKRIEQIAIYAAEIEEAIKETGGSAGLLQQLKDKTKAVERLLIAEAAEDESIRYLLKETEKAVNQLHLTEALGHIKKAKEKEREALIVIGQIYRLVEHMGF
jgi:hypothetical protein